MGISVLLVYCSRTLANIFEAKTLFLTLSDASSRVNGRILLSPASVSVLRRVRTFFPAYEPCHRAQRGRVGCGEGHGADKVLSGRLNVEAQGDKREPTR